MMKRILHTLVLILAFAFVYAWQQTILSQYIIQIIAVLVICYLLLSFKRKVSNSKIVFGGSADIFILTVIILLLVFATNGLDGGLFFILYFLAFGTSFVFEPWNVFVFTIGVCLVFLPQALVGDMTGHFLKLGSLLLLSPLAFFFGLQYAQDGKLQTEMDKKTQKENDTADTIQDTVTEVLRNEKNLKKEDRQKLENVLQETDRLRPAPNGAGKDKKES